MNAAAHSLSSLLHVNLGKTTGLVYWAPDTQTDTDTAVSIWIIDTQTWRL